MYTFFSNPGLESEYPPLSGPSPQCTHSRVLGGLQADDLGNFGLGKGHFGPFGAYFGPFWPLLSLQWPLWTTFNPF